MGRPGGAARERHRATSIKTGNPGRRGPAGVSRSDRGLAAGQAVGVAAGSALGAAFALEAGLPLAGFAALPPAIR